MQRLLTNEVAGSEAREWEQGERPGGADSFPFPHPLPATNGHECHASHECHEFAPVAGWGRRDARVQPHNPHCCTLLPPVPHLYNSSLAAPDPPLPCRMTSTDEPPHTGCSPLPLVFSPGLCPGLRH